MLKKYFVAFSVSTQKQNLQTCFSQKYIPTFIFRWFDVSEVRGTVYSAAAEEYKEEIEDKKCHLEESQFVCLPLSTHFSCNLKLLV